MREAVVGGPFGAIWLNGDAMVSRHYDGMKRRLWYRRRVPDHLI
jgi:hypothetical protein